MMAMSDFSPEVEIRPFCACAMKNMQYNPYYGQIAHLKDGDVRFKSGSRNMAVSACAMRPAIITGTVPSLSTWLWRRYHVPQNAFLVVISQYNLPQCGNKK